jgi:hypothetical protein
LAYDSPAHASPRDVVGVLATEEDAVRDTDIPTTVGWNWDDRRQIAWAGQDMQGTSSFESFPAPGLIDPTHVIVRELWIAVTGTLSTGNYCYYIELERVELDDNQAVMAMVSERNQRWLWCLKKLQLRIQKSELLSELVNGFFENVKKAIRMTDFIGYRGWTWFYPFLLYVLSLALKVREI